MVACLTLQLVVHVQRAACRRGKDSLFGVVQPAIRCAPGLGIVPALGSWRTRSNHGPVKGYGSALARRLDGYLRHPCHVLLSPCYVPLPLDTWPLPLSPWPRGVQVAAQTGTRFTAATRPILPATCPFPLTRAPWPPAPSPTRRAGGGPDRRVRRAGAQRALQAPDPCRHPGVGRGDAGALRQRDAKVREGRCCFTTSYFNFVSCTINCGPR